MSTCPGWTGSGCWRRLRPGSDIGRWSSCSRAPTTPKRGALRAQDFLTKPVQAQSLQARVKAVLRRAKMPWRQMARILIVEDNPDNMKLFRALLTLKGMK